MGSELINTRGSATHAVSEFAKVSSRLGPDVIQLVANVGCGPSKSVRKQGPCRDSAAWILIYVLTSFAILQTQGPPKSSCRTSSTEPFCGLRGECGECFSKPFSGNYLLNGDRLSNHLVLAFRLGDCEHQVLFIG